MKSLQNLASWIRGMVCMDSCTDICLDQEDIKTNSGKYIFLREKFYSNPSVPSVSPVPAQLSFINCSPTLSSWLFILQVTLGRSVAAFYSHRLFITYAFHYLAIGLSLWLGSNTQLSELFPFLAISWNFSIAEKLKESTGWKLSKFKT